MSRKVRVSECIPVKGSPSSLVDALWLCMTFPQLPHYSGVSRCPALTQNSLHTLPPCQGSILSNGPQPRSQEGPPLHKSPRNDELHHLSYQQKNTFLEERAQCPDRKVGKQDQLGGKQEGMGVCFIFNELRRLRQSSL